RVLSTPCLAVLSSEAVLQRAEHIVIDRIVREKELLAICGFSRSTLYEKRKRGEFPSPVKLGRKATGWKLSDVKAWIDGLEPSEVVQ
ncbi:AlpA family phage regulatory protein, partial [Paraburkholderia sp. SIMBA_050]